VLAVTDAGTEVPAYPMNNSEALDSFHCLHLKPFTTHPILFAAYTQFCSPTPSDFSHHLRRILFTASTRFDF
jgi:hypothetical protein